MGLILTLNTYFKNGYNIEKNSSDNNENTATNDIKRKGGERSSSFLKRADFYNVHKTEIGD